MDRQLIAFLDHFGVPRHYPAGSMIFRQGETEEDGSGVGGHSGGEGA